MLPRLIMRLGLLLLAAVPVVASELPLASLSQQGLSLPIPQTIVNPPAKNMRLPVVDPIPAAYRGRVVLRRVTNLPAKVIALTFDDGPNPDVTPLVLKTLRENHVKATFFMIGEWAQEWPDLVRQVVADGHAVGSHSYSHPQDNISIPHAMRELEHAETVIEQNTKSRLQLYRPPWGRLDKNMTHVAAKQGYCVVRWTICGNDGVDKCEADIVRAVTRTPRSGDIVLLHDGRDRHLTAAALPEIIRRLKNKGFQFVTVPQLLRLSRAQAPADWGKRPPTLLPPKSHQPLSPAPAGPSRKAMPLTTARGMGSLNGVEA